VLLSHDPFKNVDFVYRPNGSPIAKAEEKTLRLFGLPYAGIRRYEVVSRGNPKFPRQQKLLAYKPLLAEIIDSAEACARYLHRPTPTTTSKPRRRQRAMASTIPRPMNLCGCSWPWLWPRGVRTGWLFNHSTRSHWKLCTACNPP
jgi:hypothetical protein